MCCVFVVMREIVCLLLYEFLLKTRGRTTVSGLSQ